jgi:multimeric flavodoxin WrbA
MKVCGIVGSPIKNGNVDQLVSRVLIGAGGQGAETQRLYLNDLRIAPCQSCGVDPYPKYCLLDDDMETVYAALTSSDVIVLGSPVYFDTVSAQAKLAIDRCNCLMPYVIQPDGGFAFERRMGKRKAGVFIAVGGTAQEFNTIQATVRGFFEWVNAELMESILYRHDDSELGAVKDKEEMARAFELGRRIVRSMSRREEAA